MAQPLTQQPTQQMNNYIDPQDLRFAIEKLGIYVSDEKFNDVLDTFVERKQKLIDAGLYDSNEPITEEKIQSVLGHSFGA